jgi:hypothetical protein
MLPVFHSGGRGLVRIRARFRTPAGWGFCLERLAAELTALNFESNS